MGMDVFGIKPKNETGEYFRNNCWYWSPLWDFAINAFGEDRMREFSLVDEELSDGFEDAGYDPRCPGNGFLNDGWGLNAEGAEKLGERLSDLVERGDAALHVEKFNSQRAEAPMRECELCAGTGIRDDEIGVEHGMVDKELDEFEKVLLGRETGWCNGCSGRGERESFATSYHFTVDNLVDFADFCKASGGFQIF